MWICVCERGRKANPLQCSGKTYLILTIAIPPPLESAICPESSLPPDLFWFESWSSVLTLVHLFLGDLNDGLLRRPSSKSIDGGDLKYSARRRVKSRIKFPEKIERFTGYQSFTLSLDMDSSMDGVLLYIFNIHDSDVRWLVHNRTGVGVGYETREIGTLLPLILSLYIYMYRG